MSAMKVIDEMEKGGKMILLNHFVADLAPNQAKSLNYKFTGARNVVLASMVRAKSKKEPINTFRIVIYFVGPSFTSRRVWSI
jgi:hypothetical protein